MVLPAPFRQCKPHLTPGGSGVLATRLGLTRNSERLGFPTFAVLGKGRPALKNSMRRLRDGYPFLPVFSLPRLTGEMLADVCPSQGACGWWS